MHIIIFNLFDCEYTSVLSRNCNQLYIKHILHVQYSRLPYQNFVIHFIDYTNENKYYTYVPNDKSCVQIIIELPEFFTMKPIFKMILKHTKFCQYLQQTVSNLGYFFVILLLETISSLCIFNLRLFVINLSDINCL